MHCIHVVWRQFQCVCVLEEVNIVEKYPTQALVQESFWHFLKFYDGLTIFI